jgi:tight adherence protein C
MEKRLMYAGLRSAKALPLFYAIKTGLALALMLGVLAASAWLPQWSAQKLVFFAMLAALVGLVLPNYVLDQMIERRQKRLRDGFPDALDLLVVCVEAGLGLTAALQRVSEELKFSHPDLGSEFARVTAEMRAGIEREAALKALAFRTGLEDIRGLVSLLIQTLKFGTSIGDTLRVYAEEFRDKRMQRAEELAAKIGTKLIFPLVFCLFPSFFIVAIGPAVVRIMEVFRFLGEKVTS